VFEVAFCNVGLGNGDYEQLRSTANGKVFRFVGRGQGSFLPLRIVPTPKKDQMFTLGGAYKLTSSDKFYAEIALSEHDQNLYSNLDEGDDQGKAIKVGYVNEGKKLPFSNSLQWLGTLDF